MTVDVTHKSTAYTLSSPPSSWSLLERNEEYSDLDTPVSAVQMFWAERTELKKYIVQNNLVFVIVTLNELEFRLAS